MEGAEMDGYDDDDESRLTFAMRKRLNTTIIY